MKTVVIACILVLALVNLVLSQTTNTAAVTTAVSSPMTTGSTVPPVSQGSLAPQVCATVSMTIVLAVSSWLALH